MFQIKYEWKLKDLSRFLKTENSSIAIWSPVFIASPDELIHRWKVGLLCDTEIPDFYGLYLALEDVSFQQDMFISFCWKAFNFNNELISEGTTGEFYEVNKSWVDSSVLGHIEAIDRSKHNLKSIQKVCLNIDLSRIKPNNLEDICRQLSDVSTTNKVIKEVETINQKQQTDKVMKDLVKLYENKAFVDLKILCGDREFNAHKNILASRSTVFETMFENDANDNISKTINIDDAINPEAMDLFLKFLYLGYVVNLPLEITDDMLKLSEKYNSQDLKALCELEMEKNITEATAVNVLILADKYKMQRLKVIAMGFIKENIRGVRKSESWSSLKKYADLMDELFCTF